jgi:hypothetical protein
MIFCIVLQGFCLPDVTSVISVKLPGLWKPRLRLIYSLGSERHLLDASLSCKVIPHVAK